MKNLLIKLKNQDSFFSFLASSFFFLILAVFSPYFFKANNLLSLQAIIAPRVIMAAGMMLVIALGMFDLSVGSVMGLAGILCGYLLSRQVPIMITILAALGAGLVVGIINGFLITFGKIIPLIATLGTMIILRGFAEMIMTSKLATSLTGFPKQFIDFGNNSFFGIYTMLWIAIILLAMIQFFIKSTYIGHQIYYIGGNKESAKSLGFSVKWITLGCFAISGFLAALAGVLSIARFQSASRYLGQGIQMDILIACLIGGGSLHGGKGDMKGAIFGTVFIALLENSFNLFEINSLFKSVVIGAVLVIVVMFDGYVHLNKMRKLGRV